MSNVLEGKVAAILNARELVINIGKAQGVSIGMKFKVLAEAPFTVEDPDTGQPIGEIDREKIRVKVLSTEVKFSICKTYRETILPGDPTYSLFRGLVGSGKPPERVVETLRADSEDKIPPLAEKDSFVKKGDRVIQLFDDD